MATAPDFKDLAAFTAADMANAAGFTNKLNRVVETLQLIIGTRGPGRGNPAWFQTLVDAGLLDGRGGVIRTPPGSGDTTPPPVPTGLDVTPGINHIFITWDAATYGQGGGNAYTTIYGATYDDPTETDPLPTFASAVPIATVPFSTEIYAHPTAPNVQWHIWIAFTTYADVTGSPAGGTNGFECTSGKLDGAQHIEALTVTNALIANLAVDDAKIANLGVNKLVAGAISTGQYIESSGFVSGVQGFKIEGDGDAEFNNAIFRGAIYAGAGAIGGAIIDASGVESDNYVLATTGWRLDNDDGIFAFQGTIGGFTIAGKKLTLGTATLAGTGSGIAMGTDTDTLNKLFVGNAAGDFMYFNGTTLTFKGSFEAYSASISGGSVSVTVSNGLQFYANRTVTVTGGKSPYTYQWFVANHDNEDDDTAALILGLTGDPETIGISGRATNSINSGSVVCTVTDANGRTLTAGVPVSATHGTPP